jgi:hypothetical protein
MGERIFGDLLEFIDKRYPQGVTKGELINAGFSEDIIIEAYENLDFIGNPIWAEQVINTYEAELVLTSNGFLVLNQIRMKKATDELNKSITKFSESSNLSSSKMEKLTLAMLILAVITAIPLIIGFVKWIMTLFTKVT